MSKKKDKSLDNEERSIKLENPKKKKKTPYEKRKIIMKVVGFFMAAVMIVGTLLSIFGMLFYN